MPPTDPKSVGSLDKAFAALKRERVTWESRWRDCADYILPSRPAFLLRDIRKGNRSSHKILDTTATQGVRIATSGLLNGMASPSRPWFQLTTVNRETAEIPSVKRWAEDARDALLGIMERSNYYTQTGDQLQDELVFGTSAKMILEDPDPSRVIRCQVLPIGGFWIAQNAAGYVETLGREYTMTVVNAVREFGEDKLSHAARDAYRNQQLQHPVAIRHLIELNTSHQPGGVLNTQLKFREVYWETAGSSGGARPDTPTWGGSTETGDQGGILREGGYHEFPGSVARWGRNHDDVYASDWPAADALGDIKQLQTMERVALNGLNKMVNPPLKGGTGVQASAVSQLAGSITIEQSDGDTTLAPIHEVRIPLDHLESKAEQVRERVRRAFMVDIFLMLLNDSRGQPPTAEEVRQRMREKLAVLGPVLERHADDVFDRDIERIAGIAMRRSAPAWEAGHDGILPRPPDELQEDLEVTYVSEIAQAQKLVGVGSLERHLTFVAQHAEINPGVVDVVNYDEAMRRHADMMGLPHEVSASKEEVDAKRQQKAAMAQQQQAAEQLPGLARAARDLSQVDPTIDTGALDEVAG